MMPNVVRGDRMAGLMTYLMGPGRANEHTEPHLVAGDDALMVWHNDDELDRDAGVAIARHLDQPRGTFGVEVTGGHVWHCSLSLRAEEGMLTDEQWGEIARDFIAGMEFDDQEGTRAPCRWAAVRHGVSKNGNDHIHVVVNLVREDATKASTHVDFRRAQRVARALEIKHGLERLESVQAERSTRGWHPAEREAQARSKAKARHELSRAQGAGSGVSWEQLTRAERQARIMAEMRRDQPRHTLAVRVRGCAEAAQDEAEWVRRMRRVGLLVRPRFAAGRTDVIVGYSVAERPEFGERPIWYGGGQLAHDLRLPRIRERWLDTPEGASAAAAEWIAARRGRRVVAPGREAVEASPQVWERQAEELRLMVERLRGVGVDDRDLWATVARQSAGVLAAWSNAVEEAPGDLARAAEALSRSGQTHRPTITPQRAGTTAITGTALLVASAVRGGQGTVAQAVMIRQLLRMAQAVYDVSVAAEQFRYAELLLTDTRQCLLRVRDRLPAPAKLSSSEAEQPSVPANIDPELRATLERMRAANAYSATKAVSPMPPRLSSAARPVTSRPHPASGLER